MTACVSNLRTARCNTALPKQRMHWASRLPHRVVIPALPCVPHPPAVQLRVSESYMREWTPPQLQLMMVAQQDAIRRGRVSGPG